MNPNPRRKMEPTSLQYRQILRDALVAKLDKILLASGAKVQADCVRGDRVVDVAAGYVVRDYDGTEDWDLTATAGQSSIRLVLNIFDHELYSRGGHMT